MPKKQRRAKDQKKRDAKKHQILNRTGVTRRGQSVEEKGSRRWMSKLKQRQYRESRSRVSELNLDVKKEISKQDKDKEMIATASSVIPFSIVGLSERMGA